MGARGWVGGTEALMVRPFFSAGLYGCPPAICVRAQLPVWVGKAGGTCVHRDRFGIDKEEQSWVRQSMFNGYTVQHSAVQCSKQCGTIQKPPNLDLDPDQV